MLKPFLLSLILFSIGNACAANGKSPADSCEPYRSAAAAATDENTKVAGNIPYGNGLLWKITDSDNHSIYIFGTMHSQDRRVTDIPPPVRLALARSRTFVMEVLLNEQANETFANEIYFADDQRLDNILPADIYQLLAEKIPDYGIPRENLHRLEPWAAFTLVGRPKPVNAPTQDIKLMQMARAANMQITSLESMPELLDTLQGLSLADQAEILKDTVCNHGEIMKQAGKLVKLYTARDLAGITRLNDEPHHDEEVFNRYIKRVLYDRNERMLARIESHLENGKAFVAVGASHLPGERGLLKMLEEKGYTIDRVY